MAIDCNGKEIKVVMKITGVMSEIAIMNIEGIVEIIIFEDNEAYGRLNGREEYWYLRQFEI